MVVRICGVCGPSAGSCAVLFAAPAQHRLFSLTTRLYGAEEPLVYHNDGITIEGVSQLIHDGKVGSIILSPGPGSPLVASDVGAWSPRLPVCRRQPRIRHHSNCICRRSSACQAWMHVWCRSGFPWCRRIWWCMRMCAQGNGQGISRATTCMENPTTVSSSQPHDTTPLNPPPPSHQASASILSTTSRTSRSWESA